MVSSTRSNFYFFFIRNIVQPLHNNIQSIEINNQELEIKHSRLQLFRDPSYNLSAA